MGRFRLSKLAESDLANIADFGIERFGLVQARKYRDGFFACFKRIAERPFLYGSVDELRPGYRRAVYESHSIYYVVLEDQVLIVRVLGREDPDLSLPV